MLKNSSKDSIETSPIKKRLSLRASALAILLPAWVLVSFLIAEQLVVGLIWLLRNLHVPLSSMNENVLTAILAAVIYVITISLVIGLPWIIKKRRVSREDIGLSRLPLWRDVLMALAGFVVYLVLSGLMMFAASSLIPSFDAGQHQDTGFAALNQRYELILAFITLVIIAPVAEEILFRGYLFGKLKKIVPVWIAILVTSLLFGFIHGAWNLAIDTFALSVILCLLRLNTGSLWAPILVHMIKNGVAFYILFVYPVFNGIVGQ